MKKLLDIKFSLKYISKIIILLFSILGIIFLSKQTLSPHISYSILSIPTQIPSATSIIIQNTFTPTITYTVLPTQEAKLLNNSEYIPPQKDFFLYIPKLEVKAPIFSNISGVDKDAYLKVLENGVAHYAGTNLPGEAGRVFIFGHSSYYRNRPGNYKTIFAKLNNLIQNDEIIIYYQQNKYSYRVTSKNIVNPDDTNVLLPTENKTLTLQTCWPPGTTDKRLVVNSEQIN